MNKNWLENGSLVGFNSFTLSIKGLLSQLTSQKFNTDLSLFVAKGRPGALNVLHKDSTIVDSATFTTSGSDHTLEISFKNDLPKGIYSYEFNIILSQEVRFDILHVW